MLDGIQTFIKNKSRFKKKYVFEGKYFQVILLVRQNLVKIKCEGSEDLYGKFSKSISE